MSKIFIFFSLFIYVHVRPAQTGILAFCPLRQRVKEIDGPEVKVEVLHQRCTLSAEKVALLDRHEFSIANSQFVAPGQYPCAGPIKAMSAPCCNPQPVRNTVLGCLDPVITPCGTIAEVPLNLGNLMLPGPALSSLVNRVLPPNIANPFLPVASPVSPYMPPISPLLPPASPCNNRCQYLKKIPIPPPCI